MFTLVKKMLCLLLLVCMATAPLGCLNINKPPDNQPKTEVNVGGDRGVTVEHDKAIICLVGKQMRYTPGISARAFGAIREMNIVMISQGASEVNLSFIIDEADVQVAIEKLHREFFE